MSASAEWPRTPGMSESRRWEWEQGGTDLEGLGVMSEGGEIPAEALDSC